MIQYIKYLLFYLELIEIELEFGQRWRDYKEGGDDVDKMIGRG